MTGLWPGTAWAKSPNQGVCAPLNAPGVTSGLYGLCVAYCEAMNCPDVTAGASALRRGCKPPDKGVLANYNRLRRASDPQMPCVKSQCPCWTNTELSAIGISYLPHVVDWFSDDFPCAYFSVSLVENRVATDEFPYGAYQVAQSVKNSDGTATCSYFKAEFQPGAPDPIIRVQEISTAEAGICEAQINGQVEDLLNEGVPVVCTGNACEPA